MGGGADPRAASRTSTTSRPRRSGEYRGTLTEPGRNSPYRDRPVEENLDLFRRMRAGEFPDGARVLRAKIDMASPNMNLRDPMLYRIRHVRPSPDRRRWCIYPMYDYAHGLSDSIERITHSLCTLEFEDHRPLYDWCCEALEIYHPQQIEFARLNLELHGDEQAPAAPAGPGGARARLGRPADADARRPPPPRLHARGDPRLLPSASASPRPTAWSTSALLEHCVREDLNRRAPRVMAVLRPLRLVIENYPEGQVEELEAVNNPEDPAMGIRKVPFSRVLWIERDDFREEPPPKYFRLRPGSEVRLRYAYIVTLHGRGEGRAHRRDRRGALHLRSRDAAAGAPARAAR